MTGPDAVLLGLIQGATEFLPVSSSAHLFLAHRLLGLQEPRLAFDLLLHLGTLVAVLYFLRSEILQIGSSMFRPRSTMWSMPSDWGRRDVGLILLTMVPTAVIGLLFADAVESRVSLWGVGTRYLILTLALLLSTARLFYKEDPERIECWEALAIGVVQGLAVFPGLSRSGSTIILMLLLGVAPLRAAKFSFIISIPAILGAAFYALRGGVPGLQDPMLLVMGFLVSAGTGYIALVLVQHYVVKGRFYLFAPYTLCLAILCFVLHFTS